MLKKCLYTSFLLALAFPHALQGQAGFTVPDYFDQFFNNYYFVNPANTDSSYKVSIKVADKSQIGLLQGVTKIYGDADLRLNTGRRQVFHFLGVQAISSKEGEFLRRSKLFARYSWRSAVSERASLSAGLSLGFVNYAFSSSQASAGGSATAPDGSAGIWYLREKMSVGISVQQMFKGKVQPIQQTFELNPHYNLNINRLFRLSPSMNLNSHFMSGFQKGQRTALSLAALLELQNKLEFGMNYRHGRSLAFIAGLKRISIGSSDFSLYFSYLSGITRIALNDNAIELFLSFQK
ncbi:MAG: type IX secretion system membrane protein PorP/SprF [Cytophagaceae bacterium]